MKQEKFRSISTQNDERIACNGISRCDVEAEQTQLNFGARIQWNSEKYPISGHLLANQLQEINENRALIINTEQQASSKIKLKSHYSTQEFGLNYTKNKFQTSLNLSKGIRTPNLFELFGDRGSFKGNSNLLPEKANAITFGLQYQIKQFNLSSSIYRQGIDNAIVAIFNTSGVGSYTNVSSALLHGFELQGDVSIQDNLSLSMQMSLIDSETSSEFIAFDDKKLPGIYHQQFRVALLYKVSPNWQVKITRSLDNELYFNRSNKFQAENNQAGSGNPADRSLTNLSLNWQTTQYHVSFSFNNLFNETYQDLANRPVQGRNIQLKFSIEDI